MRLTNRFSVMGRKYDLAYGQASTWKRKLKNDKYELIENAIDKLGQLEDIEDGLGINLITIFKALKNGIWVKREDKIEKIEITTNLRLVLDCNGSTDKMSYWILDYQDITRGNDRIECIDNWFVDKYGVEWALTKEELENESNND